MILFLHIGRGTHCSPERNCLHNKCWKKFPNEPAASETPGLDTYTGIIAETSPPKSAGFRGLQTHPKNRPQPARPANRIRTRCWGSRMRVGGAYRGRIHWRRRRNLGSVERRGKRGRRRSGRGGAPWVVVVVVVVWPPPWDGRDKPELRFGWAGVRAQPTMDRPGTPKHSIWMWNFIHGK